MRICTVPHVLILFTSMLLLLTTVRVASAAFVFNVEQVGPSIVITGSGTMNTSALTAGRSGPDSATIYASYGLFSVGFDTSATAYSTISGPAQFGPAGYPAPPTTDSGDHVGVGGGDSLVLPSGYVSGSPLSDTDTYFDETIAGIGLTQGQYVYTWGSGANADSLTINIGVVPEPASAAAVVVPATLALLRRRRRRSR